VATTWAGEGRIQMNHHRHRNVYVCYQAQDAGTRS
jgi:hypothetical protein